MVGGRQGLPELQGSAFSNSPPAPVARMRGRSKVRALVLSTGRVFLERERERGGAWEGGLGANGLFDFRGYPARTGPVRPVEKNKTEFLTGAVCSSDNTTF